MLISLLILLLISNAVYIRRDRSLFIPVCVVRHTASNCVAYVFALLILSIFLLSFFALLFHLVPDLFTFITCTDGLTDAERLAWNNAKILINTRTGGVHSLIAIETWMTKVNDANVMYNHWRTESASVTSNCDADMRDSMALGEGRQAIADLANNKNREIKLCNNNMWSELHDKRVLDRSMGGGNITKLVPVIDSKLSSDK